jgi:hypothetical protein
MQPRSVSTLETTHLFISYQVRVCQSGKPMVLYGDMYETECRFATDMKGRRTLPHPMLIEEDESG